MRPGGDERGERAPVACKLLLVQATLVQWGLDAPVVREVINPGSYHGPQPIDVAAVLGLGARAEEGRVLIVATPRGPIALRAAGHLHIVSVPQSEVLEVPSELPRNPVSAAVRAVVLRDGELPILLLSPERVAAAAGARR